MKSKTVYIDGDSFANMAKEVVVRAALKGHIKAHFVANHLLSLPKRSSSIYFTLVEMHENAADNFIVSQVQEGNIVLTRDIILASRLLSSNVVVLNDRGYQFCTNTISERLSTSAIHRKAREAGLYINDAQDGYAKEHVAYFANKLYFFINKMC